MNLKYALCGIAFAVFAMPAFAATTFYVAQDPVSKKCSVVGDSGAPPTELLLGDHVYTSHADAEKGMAAEKTCTK